MPECDSSIVIQILHGNYTSHYRTNARTIYARTGSNVGNMNVRAIVAAFAHACSFKRVVLKETIQLFLENYGKSA